MTRRPISARPLSDGQIAAALEHIAATSERPLRDELVLWLNVSAGLRAHEIAGLELSTVWEREGSVRDVIHIDRRLAKYSSARAIIVSARVREALLRFRAGYPDANTIGESFGERPTPVVRQQIEGGIVFGVALATGAAPEFTAGIAAQRRLGDLRLPRLADTPEISVELIPSTADPGGVSDLAVPVVAPAIANALFAATGNRLRHLPFGTS